MVRSNSGRDNVVKAVVKAGSTKAEAAGAEAAKAEAVKAEAAVAIGVCCQLQAPA